MLKLTPENTEIYAIQPKPNATSLCSLSQTARVFIWASRCLAFRAADPDHVGLMLEKHLGPCGPVALAHQYVFLRLLVESAAPQRIALHQPSCPCLGDDEARLIEAISWFSVGQTDKGTDCLARTIRTAPSTALITAAQDLALLYADFPAEHGAQCMM